MMPGPREAEVKRETKETQVRVMLKLDGRGEASVKTGSGMLDHLLSQIARHGLFDLTVEATGDLSPGWHHLVEDVAITLGRAFNQAMGDGRGIVRMAHALVPLDEALALVVVDVGGRPYAVVDTKTTTEAVGDLSGDMVGHFLESLALEGRITLHARLIQGINSHHKAEALFKALGRALSEAYRRDPRIGDDVPSTKGTLGG